MFGGGDDDLFGFVPDIDGDGDHDLLDFLIMDDILQEEEKELDTDDIDDFEDDDWKDECEDGSEYGLDPNDYDSEEEYEEALEEAKNARYADEDDIEFEDDESAEDDVDDDETEYDDDVSADISSLSEAISYNQSRTDLSKKIAESNIAKNTSGQVNYKGIAERRAEAKRELTDYLKGESWIDEDDAKRCRFIVESDSLAAKYLTADGIYLYSQAIKEHFMLPFSIPDETDTIITSFETLLVSITKIDTAYAFKIWDWCLDNFQQYLGYAGNDNSLTSAILLDLNNFPNSFPKMIVDHMTVKPYFIDQIILNSPDMPWGVDTLVYEALKKGEIKVAKEIMECAFANKSVGVGDKVQYITSCIEECSNYEEKETMESFKDNVFPIVYTQTDVRIKCEIDGWIEAMDGYIAEMGDSDDKYAYSGKNEWRIKYKHLSETSAAPDPVDFDTEEEYLEELNDYKYGWRRYCSNRFGIDPQQYETREEYNKAVSESAEKERKARTEQLLSDPANTKKYSFCKVSLEYPNKPHLYYLTSGLFLSVGDHVIVPLGDNNEETEGVVTAVGECLGLSFPCPVERVKKVIRRKY